MKDFYFILLCIYKTSTYYIYNQQQNQEFPFWERKKHSVFRKRPGEKTNFDMKDNGLGVLPMGYGFVTPAYNLKSKHFKQRKIKHSNLLFKWL